MHDREGQGTRDEFLRGQETRLSKIHGGLFPAQDGNPLEGWKGKFRRKTGWNVGESKVQATVQSIWGTKQEQWEWREGN